MTEPGPPARRRGARGPVPEHSRDRIAAAAVALADAEGLAAVTMRAVAAAVGAGPASLYRYVSGRDELVALMADAVSAELRIPAPSGDWRADLLELAHELRGVHERHPWMLEVGPGGTPMGPQAVAYLEGALALLAPVEAPARRKLEAIAMLTGAVSVRMRDAAQARTAPGLSQEARTAAVVEAASSGRHPHLAAAMAEATGDPPPADPAAAFDSVLLRMIDGILFAPEPG